MDFAFSLWSFNFAPLPYLLRTQISRDPHNALSILHEYFFSSSSIGRGLLACLFVRISNAINFHQTNRA